MQMSFITRTKEDKIRASAGKLAIELAGIAKDPMFARYRFSKKKYMKFKLLIMKKYGRAALIRARVTASKSDNRG